MSEFLTIRLSSRPEQPVSWLVWSPQQQEVIASGQLDSIADIATLSEYAAQRPVYGLVPAIDCLLTEVELPAGSSRQLDAVLPFLLEDELAQDVESVHVHLLKRSGSTAKVAVVEHRKIEAWLAAFAEANIAIKRLIPDCLCLPLFDDGLSAAEIDDVWLIRQGEMQGVGIEADWLPLWLESQQQPANQSETEDAESEEDAEDEEDSEAASTALNLHHYTPAPEDTTSANWIAQPPELVMQLLADGAEKTRVNLLSGPYRQQPAWRKHLKPWKKVAVAAALLLGVIVGEHMLSIQQMEQQAQAYRTESERIFRQLMPNNKRIPSSSYLKRILNNEVSRLGGVGEKQGVLNWLVELQPMLSKVDSLSVQNLKYDQKRRELRFQASAGDFQQFELLRTLLAERYEVQQGQLNREGTKVTGAVVLRRKA